MVQWGSDMFSISQQHRLSGPAVTYDGTGNFTQDRFIAPVYLVFHYTVIDYAKSVRAFGKDGPHTSSAHLVVGRTGEITQMVDFNRRAWHAGTSFWSGLSDLNTHSIGIEVENYGYLHKKPAGFFSDNDDAVDPAVVIQARHKNPACPHEHWHQYAPAQLDACENLAVALTSFYKLKEIVGHDDIAPTRKTDPGPAFPMERMRNAAFGRGVHLEEGRQYEVVAAKLNIRGGPGTGFAALGPPLMQGTRLAQLQPGSDGWVKVAVLAPGGVQGWVYGPYVRILDA